jgi:hypothetical protein
MSRTAQPLVQARSECAGGDQTYCWVVAFDLCDQFSESGHCCPRSSSLWRLSSGLDARGPTDTGGRGPKPGSYLQRSLPEAFYVIDVATESPSSVNVGMGGDGIEPPTSCL